MLPLVRTFFAAIPLIKEPIFGLTFGRIGPSIQMNTYGRSAQALRTARAYFRKFIRQHDHRITNLELGMTDSAVCCAMRIRSVAKKAFL